MPYDHHYKAGNQGDVVKHPALIAALDVVLNQQAQNHEGTTKPFHYLDLFPGHAWHPLFDGSEFEWRHGIGKLASKTLPENAPMSVGCWWHMWHDAPAWPTTTPSGYPGSSWIAAHQCRKANRPVKLELYDHSEEARHDLELAFPASHAIQETSPNICLIGQSLDPTQHNQEHIKQADFALIDPPGWQSDKNPSFPRWTDILNYVLIPRHKRPTLMWMPAGGQDRTKNKKDQTKENSGAYPWDKQSSGGQRVKCESLEARGYTWTAVRWNNDSYSACILAYNFAVSEIQAAVDCIVKLAGDEWTHRHS